MALHGTVFTNGRVSLSYCLIFGLNVMSEEGWVPWDDLDGDDRRVVRRALDHNPTCPEEWRQIVYSDDQAAADQAKRCGKRPAVEG